MDQISAWLESTRLVLLGETDTHWLTLQKLLARAKTTGSAVHDARIAALCFQHGVRELWSADRDFRRWPELKVVNPLGKKTKKTCRVSRLHPPTAGHWGIGS